MPTSMAASPARAIAYDVLRRVERSGAFASLLLQSIAPSVPAREVAFATEIVYGCLRHRSGDEHVLGVFAERPISKIDPDLRILYRIAAHQILRLDRVPDRAAVHEAVEAAKALPSRGRPGPAGPSHREAGARFLNAVLRRLCREKGSLPLPAVPAASEGGAAAARTLEVLTSHPAWMIERWILRLGRGEADALLAANNRPAPVAIRVLAGSAGMEAVRRELSAEGVETEASPVLGDFLRVTEGAPQRTTVFRRGEIYIQDEASGIVPQLLAPSPGARVWDACAAPGGKALALAALVGEDGRVVATDLHPQRLGLVSANAGRLQVGNLRLVAGDASQPPFNRAFDGVLVDAPCSGSGVYRRDVESRWRLTPGDLATLAAGQRRILDGAAGLVRPGGRLVYAVCSLEPEEGEERIEEFLARHPGFRRAPIVLRAGSEDVPPGAAAAAEGGPVEGPAIPAALSSMLTGRGELRTWPHRHDVDGFYAAALVRAGEPR